MRLALLLICVLVLAVPAGWAASRPAGSLSIEDGRGSVEIVDMTPLDQWSPRVNGVPRGRTVWTRGKNINFYVPGGRYKITVEGEGFSISARGQGLATLDGTPDAAGSTGTFAVGDSARVALPVTTEHVQYGAPAVASKVVSP